MTQTIWILSVKLKKLPQRSSLLPLFKFLFFSRDQQYRNSMGIHALAQWLSAQMSSHGKSLHWRAPGWYFWQPLHVCWRKGIGGTRVSFHLQWAKKYQNKITLVSPCLLSGFFYSLRMTKCCLSYLHIKLLGKTSDTQEWPPGNEQESCRVDTEI